MLATTLFGLEEVLAKELLYKIYDYAIEMRELYHIISKRLEEL